MSRSSVLITAALILCCGLQLHSQPRWKNVIDIHGPSFVDVFGGAIASDGSIHVAGTFEASVTINEDTLTSFGNYDNFTARLSATGSVLDFDRYGGLDADDSRSIAVDKDDNVYVCGSFLDQAIVGSERVEALDDGFGGDIYVAKMNKAGILQWVTVLGSTQYDEIAPFVAVDTLGNVYLAGGFGGTMKLGNITLTSLGNTDMFVLKMDAAGKVLWARSAGSMEFDQARAIIAEPGGQRVTVVGTFEGLVSFGNAELRSVAKNTDFAVWALAGQNGATQWVRHIGSMHAETLVSITSDLRGGSFVVGAVQGVVTCHDRTLKSNGEFATDILLTHFSATGDLTFARLYGGTNEDAALSANVGSRGDVLVTGFFDEGTTIEGTALTSNGGNDIYVMRVLMNDDFSDGVVDWVRSAGGKFDDEGRVVLRSREGEIPFVMGVYDTEADFGGMFVGNGRFSNGFIAEMECGPNTALTPSGDTVTICEGSDYEIRARAGYPEYRWLLDGERTSVVTHRYNVSELPQGTHRVNVVIADFYGCSLSSDTVTVVITEPLSEPIITRDGDLLICSVDSLTYQWYREGEEIDGATEKTVAVQGDGLYRVRVTDERGCNRTSDNFLIGTTSVDDLGGMTVAAYPNPFSDVLTVAAPVGATIQMHDVVGQTIYQGVSSSQITTIPGQGALGTYIVTVEFNGARRVLIVQRH